MLSACSSGAAPGPVTVTVTPPQTTIRATTPAAAPRTANQPPETGPRSVIEGDGTYLVGSDILPGIYRTPGGSRCYWARLDSLDTSDIIDNNNSTGPQVIEILGTDRAFQTSGCRQWTLERSQATASTQQPRPPVAVPPSAGSGGYAGMSCPYRMALTLRTTLSAVLICDEGSGVYTYKGLRLKDNARIDLPGVVPTPTGFSVTNNGTRYDISRSGLLIYTDGEVYPEPAIASGP